MQSSRNDTKSKPEEVCTLESLVTMSSNNHSKESNLPRTAPVPTHGSHSCNPTTKPCRSSLLKSMEMICVSASGPPASPLQQSFLGNIYRNISVEGDRARRDN
eukprot:GFUD01047995.1.p1 GENE.GFUD01047995.1~~GFUD01047995.1.p1  ORF type:complete len:103 (+),score=23.97 GFUD01047995.1:83-391(+)